MAFTQNLAFLTRLKSGTLIIIFNCSCVLIQILIQRRQFPKLQLLQVLVAWLQGQIVNVSVMSCRASQPGFRAATASSGWR